MKPKIIISAILLSIFFLYILGFIGDPFFFVSFLMTSIILFLSATLYILIKKKKYLISFCSIFLFLGVWVVNHYFLYPTPKKNKPIVQSSIDALKTLPYLTWVPAKEIQKIGVIQYDQKRAFEGINFYNSRNLSEAYLMDMSGKVLHTWSAKILDNDSWHHIELYKNGDLLVIIKDKMLIRLDWNSNIKWIKKMRFHHDISVAENGDIYVLARKDEVVFYYGVPTPILNDYIIVLSPDGKIKKEVSLYKLLKDENPFQGEFFKTYYQSLELNKLKNIILKKKHFMFKHDSLSDLFHTNTIEILNKNIEGLCQKGDILFSIRNINLIGILNIEQEEIIWKWGTGNLSKQHHPTLLKTNNILIFDNGVNKKRSRIIEIDPYSNKIVWKYPTDPSEKFYSHRRGSSQRFSNGNTLITESGSGHVFEITKNGKIVWEFYNPQIRKKNTQRAAIYRMMRIADLKSIQRFDINN